MRRLLAYPDFRRLFTATTVSLFGSSVTAVALPLTAVVYLHATAAQMGVLGVMALLPHLVLGLPAGVWVQRVPYRRMLVVADLARFPLLASAPVLAVFGVLQVWHLYLVALLAGIGSLFEAVAAQSFIPVVVPREQLLPANSSLMLINSTVNTTGSAVGGLLVALLTAPIALAVDAVSFLVSGLVKTRIRAGEASHPDERTGQRMLPGIVEGLRAVFAHRIVRAVTVAAAIGALAGQMQAVVHGVRAVGAALGGLVASVVDLRTTLIVGSGLMLLLGTAVAWASPLRSTHDLPDPAAAPPRGNPAATAPQLRGDGMRSTVPAEKGESC